MLLMVEKGIRGGICQAIHRHAKANNKYMKNYNKDVISSYLMYLDANYLHGWEMSQKLPVNGFKWANCYPNLMKSSYEITMKIVIQDIFSKQILIIQKSYLILINNLKSK